MTYIHPGIRSSFDSLSSDLKRQIWARNLSLNTPQDLTSAVQSIAEEMKLS